MARKAATNSTTSTPTINLPADLQQRRIDLGLSLEELARLVACEADDIHLIEHGAGRFEVMSRVMDKMKVDLTGIATGTLLHVRMRDTRLRNKGSLAALSDSTGLADRTLINLESGFGRVADFLTVLSALAPKAGIRGKGSAPGEKDTRFTPKTLLWSLCSVFGQIDWDTCGNPDSHLSEVAGHYLDRGGDGLLQRWGGTIVFMNPPFSGLSKWTDKFLAEAVANPHKIHIALVPAVTESRFFKLIPEHGGEIFYFGERTKFQKPDGKAEHSNRGMALVVFGATDAQLRAFELLENGYWWVRKFAQPFRPAADLTQLAADNSHMRREEKIQTSCPNFSAPAHVEKKNSNREPEPSCPIKTELEAEFRDPHGLRKRAEYYGRRCQTDPEDLLSWAIERALRRAHWENGVFQRIESILASLCSTINRARARSKRHGVDLTSLDDGTIIDREFPSSRDPIVDAEMEARRRGSERALELISGGDPVLIKLIDGIDQGARGRALRDRLGVGLVDLATKRRCLKRSAEAVCKDLCVGGRIEGTKLAEFGTLKDL